ncbi:hypothetical protein AMJ85_02250 [candidate division BRC1 bacterium SM23_51]|nr:MAG: hypothetical protein AMJ85_02250 [candidate division BRC1 bacterium SM23_51]
MTEVVGLFRDEQSRRDALCRYQRRELLRIGLRDLMDWASLEQVTAELSDLAEATVRTALGLCETRLQGRFGSPLCGDGPAPSGFAVIAMGKLGGHELNYSSDIDLIFIYESPGKTSGVVDRTEHHSGSISNQEYFAKLGADLIDFLSRHGPEGHLYRVDMRLRPEGAGGALAHSLAACQNYYLERARLWERIAMLKARGIAGSPALVEQFEQLAAGFVFAPATPAVLLAETARLKDRIDHEVAISDHADREVKRGRGGIREIEFIVATLEILHGQDRPQVRERSTLAAINALAGERILTPEDARLLESAYRFFRQIEHALQCVAWRQTHVVPTDESEQAALAARCGIRPAKSVAQASSLCMSRAELAAHFEAERRRLADAVHRLFDEIFRATAHRAAGEVAEQGPSPLRLLDSDCSAEEAAALLARWRLRDPTIAESLRRLARGTPALFVSAEGQRRFERLLPAFLESCRRSPWPDNAVRHFEAFIGACGDAAGYYRLLDGNSSVLDLLVRLFGTSTQMAQRLIADPGLLESLVAAETFETPPKWLGQMRAELTACGTKDSDARLRALRDLSILGSLRVGVRYILGLASSSETAQTLSALADACVEAATLWASEDLASTLVPLLASPPSPLTSHFAVLALGKLGRRELTFLSDLDLVFIADTSASPPAGLSPEGAPALESLFTRIAERLVFYLTDPAAGSAPFRVDARLRPEGASSPLVTSLRRFSRHFERSPDVWEIQTYLGARTVAGDRRLGEHALRIATGAIPRVGGAVQVAEAIRSMRQRLEASVDLPAWAAADFKRGRGGLVDLEFIAQYVQIIHANERDSLSQAVPREVFVIAAEEGWLGRAEAESLTDDYEFLRRLETDVRLVLESRQTCFPADSARLEALIHAPGRQPSSPESLRSEFEQVTQRVRRRFTQILGG